jgi:hypothetical protein
MTCAPAPRAGGAARGPVAGVALDVKVILTPPCIFHQWFSIQRIHGGIRMTL